MTERLVALLLLVLESGARWMAVFVVALAVSWLLRGQRARARHALWLCAIVSVAALPLLERGLPRVPIGGTPIAPYATSLFASAGSIQLFPSAGPQWKAPSVPGRAGHGDSNIAAEPPGGGSGGGAVPSRTIAWLGLWAWIWLLVSGVLVARELLAVALAAVLVRAGRLVSADTYGAPLGPDARHHPSSTWPRNLPVRSGAVAVPMLCGIVRPCILLPRDWRQWPPSWVACAVAHEAVHFRRKDVGTQFAARLLCAVFWFQPALWYALRRMQAEAERATDEEVLVGGVDRYVYAHSLLALARVEGRRTAPAGLPMAGTHPLHSRILHIIREPRRRARRSSATSALALLALLLVTVAAATPSLGAPAQNWLERTQRADGSVVWRNACVTEAAGCESLRDEALTALDAAGGGIITVMSIGTGEVQSYVSVDAMGARAPIPSVRTGAVAMLPLAALWWEAGMGDRAQPCPAVINLAGAGSFANGNGLDTGVIRAPHDVLALRCSTGAVAMGWYLDAEIGSASIARGFSRFGFGGGSTRFDERVDMDPRPAPPSVSVIHDERTTWMLAGSEHGTVRTSPLHIARFLRATATGGQATAPTRAGFPAHPEPDSLFSTATARGLMSAMAAAAQAAAPASRDGLVGLSSGRILEDDGRHGELFAGLVQNDAGRPVYAIVVWLENDTGEGVDDARAVAAGLPLSTDRPLR